MNETQRSREAPADIALSAAPILRCPRCRSALSAGPSELACAGCGASFPIEEGVIRLAGNDDFYEGVYMGVTNYLPNESPLSLVPLYLINTHYLWYVRRFVPEGAALLELGCGGGVKFFAKRTRATGLDLSFASVRALDASYHLSVQGDALDMPIRDGQYDAVVSAYFYEHIRPEDKSQLLSEVRRVLAPGGRVVFLFDVTSDNPLFRWFKRDPEKFAECFIEHDHHYGLEPASVALRRFEDAGFRVLDKHLANKTPAQHLPVYSWAKPYGRAVTNVLARAAEAIAKNRVAHRIYTLGLTVADDAIESLLPMDWSRIMLVALEKV